MKRKSLQTGGTVKAAYINRLITITDDIYLVFFSKRDCNKRLITKTVITLSGFCCIS